MNPQETPWLSILLIRCSRRTVLQFHCVVLSGQSCDSSMGQEERARVERRFAAGHLQDTIGLATKKGRKQQTFHLVHLA